MEIGQIEALGPVALDLAQVKDTMVNREDKPEVLQERTGVSVRFSLSNGP